MSVGYLACAFDLLNVRDLDLINQASGLCDALVVGVFTDDFTQEHTGRRPVVPEGERLAIVERVRGVREAVLHQSWDSSPGEIVFADRDVELPTVDAGVVILSARRDSRSTMLRGALAGRALAAVA